AQNRVRYAMNGFVISVGTSVEALTDKSKEVAKEIGKVTVDVGGTACKVPLASAYIDKVIAKGKIGVKRKTARC
ncbi:MAG: glycerol kinase, partial [Polaribacter sp.]